MTTFTDQRKLADGAYNALKRIRGEKEDAQKKLEEQSTRFRAKKSTQLFEEYTDSEFESKLKLDVNVYNQFMKGITEDQLMNIKSLLGNMLETSKSIYEYINIKPKVYGFKQLNSDASENELQLEAKRLINDYLNKTYYSLTNGQRYEKYNSSVTNLTYEYVTEDKLSIADATEHAYKTIIVESLIRNINFPYLIQEKINELTESDMYAEMFDKEKLIDLTEKFNSELHILSRIFATTI